MKAINLFLFTFCSAFLMASTTALSQNSTISITQQSGSFQSQEIAINLGAGNIKKPYILKISAPKGTQVTGKITRKGKVIKQLKGNQTLINLSPLLTKGKQTIKVLGSYKPAYSSIQVKFSGPGTQVSQETSGNGKINQTLIVNVQ